MSEITGAAMVAGIIGRPVTHSLSPVLHNAWIEAAGLNAVYAPLAPTAAGFRALVDGLRGGVIRGVNVTIPFKEEALAVADEASDRARLAGAANLLLFRDDGTIFADNTDGLGMLGALAVQVPGFDPRAGPAVILGAGGAARGAAAAVFLAGAPEIRIVNRTADRAEALARDIGATVSAVAAEGALIGANLIVNATSLGLGGGPGPDADLAAAPKTTVVLDMVYKPLRTDFLIRAAHLGLRTVDGLEMLIRQAIPSFEAFFDQAPPAGVDVRALALRAVGESA
ncbi:MAG: shikimate dehydrogenase [Caulobacterales bacterium]|nr:shikimate dehydrogenase [Caulobacterales bacterium]